MATALEKLIEFIPPSPLRKSTDFDWNKTEKVLGVILPQDYKDMIDIYGFGVMADYFRFYVPDSPSAEDYTPVLEKVAHQINDESEDTRCAEDPEYYRELGEWEDLNEIFAHKPYPLLAWCETTNGGTLFWDTRNPDPDKWQIITLDSRSVDNTFHGTATEYIYDILAVGKHYSPVISEVFEFNPPPISPETRIFYPYGKDIPEEYQRS